ncbi:hypothetical protein [Nocardiopsis coralliicola]
MPFDHDTRTAGAAPAPTPVPAPHAARTTGEFVQAMRSYRSRAGNPGYDEMERRSGEVCTAARFQQTLEGGRAPTVALVGAFITACGGDADDCSAWTSALRALRLRASARGDSDSGAAQH